MRTNTKAFTLIELLVVVLIIGILAAVAVPQYQKAVYKSRTMEAITLLQALTSAREVYYLSNGTYATDISQLDVDIPSGIIFNDQQEDSDKYKYRCMNQYCAATTSNPNLPELAFYRADKNKGVRWCAITDAKNSVAKSVCQSLGQLDTQSGNNKYDWFKDKYWIIN